MDEEIKAIERNGTWDLVEFRKGYKPIGVKCLYKKKMNPQRKIERYKARLVAKGYKQKAKMETIQLLLSLIAQLE